MNITDDNRPADSEDIPDGQAIEESDVPMGRKTIETSSDKAVERKTRRLNLLMLPSIMEDLQKIATMKRTSVNELINCVMGAYAKDQNALVRQYDEIFDND